MNGMLISDFLRMHQKWFSQDDGILLPTRPASWYVEEIMKEETAMKLRIALSVTLLAGFALLLACETGPQQTTYAPGGGKVRIVKLTVPDCG